MKIYFMFFLHFQITACILIEKISLVVAVQLKNLNHQINNIHIFAFIYLVKNAVFIPKSLVKAVLDEISAKTVPTGLHHTVRVLIVLNVVPDSVV